MTVLFEQYKGRSKFNSACTVMKWHTLFPLVASATVNGVVSIYTDEGDRQEGNISRSTTCSSLAWHPKKPFLVSGWKDGSIFTYVAENEYNISEVNTSEIHNAQVVKLEFSPDGTKLVSADKTGKVCFWKYIEERNKFELLQEYKLDELVTHILFFETTVEGMEEKTFVLFAATESGQVHVLNEIGNQRVVFNVKSEIAAFLYHEEKSCFVVLTFKSILSTYNVTKELKVTPNLRSKINVSTGGNCQTLSAVWVGSGVMATCANESLLRVWNLDTDDTFQLSHENIVSPVVQMAFNKKKRVLVGVTDTGILYSWQYVGSPKDPKAGDDWEFYAEFNTDANIDHISWGPGEDLIAYTTNESTVVLQETTLQSKLRGNLLAIQTSRNNIMLNSLVDDKQLSINSGMNIKEMDCTSTHLVLSNKKQLEVFTLREQLASFHAKPPIHVESTCIAIHNEAILACVEDRVEVYSFSGTKKQTLHMLSNEGLPSTITVEGDIIVVGTSNAFVKIYRMGGREVKSTGAATKLFNPEQRTIYSLSINCDGTKVSILSKEIHGNGILQQSTKMMVYDLNTSKMDEYDFSTIGRYPTSHFWDKVEPKLLSLEAKKYVASSNDSFSDAQIEVVTVFATPDHGILIQDTFPLDRSFHNLVGGSVPSLYFTLKEVGEGESPITLKSLRDFEGINVKDNATRDALLKFSYNLTIGNMEEAYKSVKMINDEHVWHNMAQMCVKTKKMDIAELCLSKMKNAAASKAFRQAKKEPEMEARVAMLAIQLGMYDEAEKLYKQAGRFDLLTKFLMARGHWDSALENAEKQDRVHLRTTHYMLAKHLESIGDFESAISQFENAKAQSQEVPRMLYDAQQINRLQTYVSQSNDTTLHQWWAQYCEGHGNYQEAFKYYIKAHDFLALVRMNCFMGQWDKAKEIVGASGDRAAAFHLARQFEIQNEHDEAIKFFKIAKRYKHALRVAIKKDNAQTVMSIALESPQNVKKDAAEYFENKGMMDKAVLLHQKGGNLSRAIELCFKEELYDELGMMSDDLDENVDSKLLQRCAEFFVDHGKFDKAVMMLVNAKEVQRALELCQSKNVEITEDIAKLMVPSKDSMDPEERKELILRIADVSENQNNFATAAKMYVQAGDKLSAMKALIRSGKTEKIIYFAVLSRKKELYVLAANYLQTLEWYSDDEITNSISSFYKKAKAWEKLATFYTQRAEVEISQMANYEKALESLNSSKTVMAKVKSSVSKSRLDTIKNRIYLVERYLELKKLLAKNNSSLVTGANELMADIKSDPESVRLGHIYALLVEYYYRSGDKQQAFEEIQKMKSYPDIDVNYYLEYNMIKDIYATLGEAMDEDPNDANHGTSDPLYDPNAGFDYNDDNMDQSIEFEEEEVF
mmetsp:Transcript_7629/g.11331  ORF Transcript_7629/g.11331 Transcript_7629/m.11331 type:complete len:1382 (+) Transcript_7629:16-4161(+)